MKFSSKRVLGFVGLIIGLSLCGVGLRLLLSPAQYQAVVRVQFGHDDPGVPNPYFIQPVFEIVRSDVVLSNVVEKLNLLENWDGHGGTMAAAIYRLRQRTIVQPVKNVAWVMEIRVVDKNPETAAGIANAVAKAYCDNRIGNLRQEKIRGLKIMQDEYQKEATDIKVQKQNLERLKEQLDLTNQETKEATLKPGYSAYVQAEGALTNVEAIHRHRKDIIAMWESTDDNRPPLASELGIGIVHPAVLPSAPIGPNRLFGLILLVCGLGVSVLGCYLISAGGSTIKTTP